MGLAVYLEDDKPITVENTCYACGHVTTEKILKEYFSNRITHNLARMANECGLYEVIWRPEKNDIQTAKQLIPFLKEGLKVLQEDEEKLFHLEPENGWGSYEYLVRFVEQYLDACERFPNSTVRAEG